VQSGYPVVPPGHDEDKRAQVDASASAEVPESKRLLQGEIEFCMALFGLKQHRLFYERVLETKVAVAWSADRIVLAARGTSTRANALADLNACCTYSCGYIVTPASACAAVERLCSCVWSFWQEALSGCGYLL
jgi:hypothetical protein